MSSNLWRRVVLIGAMLAVAFAAASPAQAASTKADRGHYGKWVQTGWNIDDRVLPCPVDLALPAPAPSIVCTDDTFLVLKKNGRYATNMSVFKTIAANKGVYEVAKLAGDKQDAIVFDDDGTGDSLRAYRVQVRRAAAGSPATMTISTVFSNPRTEADMNIKMVFARSTN